MLKDLAYKIWNDVDDMLGRAAWTAAQTGGALLVADAADWANPAVWKTASIAAIAAGLSSLKTAVKQKLEARKEEEVEVGWNDAEPEIVGDDYVPDQELGPDPELPKP